MKKGSKPLNNKMTVSEAGRLGAEKTNAMRTTESRIRAAKKGWRLRKARLNPKV